MTTEITDLTNLPAWAWMWLLALTLFFAAKGLTIARLPCPLKAGAGPRLLAYTFLWPGMDVEDFCSRVPAPKPGVREWQAAAAKTLSGAALLWMAVPLISPTRPLLRGWTGMLGLVLLLHFGFFHLLSLTWRASGVNALPIMKSPGTATSLQGFWGARWNAAFTHLMHMHFFTPLARKLGPHAAFMGSFLLSGAVHELVISVPARGGYGLPTLYFALQGAGVLFERSRFGQRFGLGQGVKGWCFVVLVAGGPAMCLFHPIFVRNVILPMLHAIGAT